MIIVIPSFLIFSNPITTTGWVFTEKRTGFSIYEDQYFRFETQETFFLESFQTDQTNGLVKLNIMKDGTDGEVKQIEQPLKRANFIFYFVQEGALPLSFEALPLLVRDNSNVDIYPFNVTESNFLSNIICEQSSCRFNLDRENDFFNFNFEFLQASTINGVPVNLTVNVELNTNNFDSGLIERTAVHIIKRDENQKIIYQEDHTIQVTNQLVRYLRVLDNESLHVPYLLLGVWVLARVYISVSNYIERNKIRLWYKENSASNDQNKPVAESEEAKTS